MHALRRGLSLTLGTPERLLRVFYIPLSVRNKPCGELAVSAMLEAAFAIALKLHHIYASHPSLLLSLTLRGKEDKIRM